jgi:hypothetical protein
MSVLRQQFLRQVATGTIANGATATVDILGPETTLAPPYAENTDHVIRDRQVRQNESGWVIIEEWDGSVLDAANVFVDVEIWSRASSAAQKGLTAPLFPSGATAAADPILKRVVATDVEGNSDALTAIFGGAWGGADDKDVPLLHVRADEFVRLSITNSTGGGLASVTLAAKYNLGQNPADNQLL